MGQWRAANIPVFLRSYILMVDPSGASLVSEISKFFLCLNLDSQPPIIDIEELLEHVEYSDEYLSTHNKTIISLWLFELF